MNIEQIETFLDLCETRNFGRTADRLGITQSTVSGRVRALELQLARGLFTRSRSGTELTLEGLRFEPHARALRHGWAEAVHATRSAGTRAMTLRIGIQHDLTGSLIGGWVRDFRAALPDAGFYIEADYSPAMASDLLVGALDFAMMYSPRMHPDLYFETLGEIRYRMVSTLTDRMAGVGADSYILTNFSPAFAENHARLHPSLATAPVSSGQSTAIAGLMTSLGGTAYVIGEMAAEMVANGQCRPVVDAPVMEQTVFAAIHLRNRHRPTHRRLLQLLRAAFARRRASDLPQS